MIYKESYEVNSDLLKEILVEYLNTLGYEIDYDNVDITIDYGSHMVEIKPEYSIIINTY